MTAAVKYIIREQVNLLFMCPTEKHSVYLHAQYRLTRTLTCKVQQVGSDASAASLHPVLYHFILKGK